MPNQPTPQDVAAYAIRAGQDPARVATQFGLDGTQSSLGGRARSILESYGNDPEFVRRLFAGDPSAMDEFNKLTIGISFQNEADAAEQLRASTEGVAAADAERAAQAEAARAAEEAKSAEK